MNASRKVYAESAIAAVGQQSRNRLLFSPAVG